jgi:hypothetical protein
MGRENNTRIAAAVFEQQQICARPPLLVYSAKITAK